MSYHIPYRSPQYIHKKIPANINRIDRIVNKLKFFKLILNMFFTISIFHFTFFVNMMGVLGFEPRSAGLFLGHRSSYSS